MRPGGMNQHPTKSEYNSQKKKKLSLLPRSTFKPSPVLLFRRAREKRDAWVVPVKRRNKADKRGEPLC